MRVSSAAAAVAILASAACARARAPGAPPPTQADEDGAKAHFLAGQAYYEQSSYADAVKEFNEAHRLSRRPDLLYNIAVCHERLGQWDEAAAALRQYLAERPGAPDRVAIESRIARYVERRDAERARAVAALPVPLVAPPPVLPPAPHRRHIASLIVGGAGAALLLAALGTGVAAHVTYDDLSNQCANRVCDGQKTALRDEADLGRRLTISTDVLIGVGAAALAVGVVLLIVESRRPRGQM